MNIAELLKLGAGVTLAISASDLKEFGMSLIAEAAARPQEKEERFLSVDEVCEMLHVSQNTLWRWNKSGYLCAKKIGRTPMYLLSDVDNLRKGA